MNIKEIKELIDKINESNLNEFVYNTETESLTLRKEKAIANQMMVSAEPVVCPPTTSVANITVNQENTQPEARQEVKAQEGHIIRSPIVGTFYTAANPTSEPFVKVGDKVKKGQVVCIIEAMKLMNEIESDVNGEIVEILVKNAQMVEYDQPLFVVK